MTVKINANIFWLVEHLRLLLGIIIVVNNNHDDSNRW